MPQSNIGTPLARRLNFAAPYYLLAMDKLAAEHHIGLVDSYAAFREKVKNGEDVKDYMSQVNHPNEKGHQVVTDLILRWF